MAEAINASEGKNKEGKESVGEFVRKTREEFDKTTIFETKLETILSKYA